MSVTTPIATRPPQGREEIAESLARMREERGLAAHVAEVNADHERRRAEGAAAERERIRLELLAEADAQEERRKLFRASRTESQIAGRVDALRDFARRLEAP